MKILYLVDSYYPEIRSPTRLSRDLTVELAAQGHQVTLLTPTPNLSPATAEECVEGVRILRVRTGPLKGVNRLRRAVNEIRLSGAIWSQAGAFLTANRHDLVVSYSPTIFFGGLVRRLKALWGVPAYLVLRDLFPQWTAHAGLLSERSPIYRYFARQAEAQYRAADVIGAQSEGDLAFFAGSPHRVEVLYNWFRPELPAPDGRDWRAAYGVAGKFVFFYGGNIGVAQNLDLLLRLAGDLRSDPRAHFLLVGDGSEAERLRGLIGRAGLGNIAIHASVPEADYFRLLAAMDVGVLSLDPRLRNSNLPAKMLGYMALRKPILGALNAGHELFGLLREAGAGLCCEAEDYPALLAHARRLLDDPAGAHAMGEAGGRLLASRFSAPAAARQITAHWTDARA